MSSKIVSLARRAFFDQHGQVLPWTILMMTILLGFAAFALDIGNALISFRQLQAATDAAALAGALNLKGSYSSAVTNYSAAGGANVYNNFTTVTIVTGYPKLLCLNTIKSMGVPCFAPNGANAIQVAEQATIPTFFSTVFGVHKMTINAISTAAVVGSRATPYNVAIVIDTTASMATVDTSTGCNAARLTCALNGVQVLLQGLSPCATTSANCTVTNGVAAHALDQVSVFTFPNVTVGTVANDYNCGGSNPTIVTYMLPASNATTYSPSGSGTGTYQITGFLSDYRTSDSATTLNSSSDLAMVTGAGVKNGNNCAGLSDPGGDGTYYAGVIYAAQAALTAQWTAEGGANAIPQPQNLMIILTDGEANASSSKMNTASNSAWNNNGTYPSAIDQCQQAVAAANYAKTEGTTVYTVAYGSESSGCTTDTTNAPGINEKDITPCQVMSQMASGPSYFYSDYNQSGSGSTCISAGNPETTLNDIFTAIVSDLLVVRLIPNGTT